MMRRWPSRVRADRGDGAVRLRIAAMVAFETDAEFVQVAQRPPEHLKSIHQSMAGTPPYHPGPHYLTRRLRASPIDRSIQSHVAILFGPVILSLKFCETEILPVK
jgi:hypothetical protein